MLGTVRIVITNAAALTKLTAYLPGFQKNPILRKLLHDTGRSMSFITDLKSTAKPAESKSKSSLLKTHIAACRWGQVL